MISFRSVLWFDWDSGNLEKNQVKHHINSNEIEEVFLDESLIVVPDRKHSKQELRFVCLGKTQQEKICFVAYTTRNKLIRVISARLANKKERKIYEKQV